MRHVALGDLFTADEVERARRLRAECKPGEFARRCAAEIVGPVMDRINRVTRQENDAAYMAYVLEYALGRMDPAPGDAPGGGGPRR